MSHKIYKFKIFTYSLIILLIICLVCCVVSLCCICFCCVVSFICGMIALVIRQILKLRKYGRLKDFDLLLQEQEIEYDTSIAHLRINKSLFEINYDEIKIEKILGEGGSQSVVYMATWRGISIAFKCKFFGLLFF